jgi:hypothetical protein
MAAPSLYRPGSRVREIASPHRQGTVVTVQGRGQYARVWWRPDGRPIVESYPSALALA